jgi:thioredoxin reductase/Fe-S-cluster-containing hydrogenase component 2/CRP-like cAMP-binding protein
MYPEFGVAIVGSGPAGMSAATRAAKSGLSHILLERRPNLTDTVFRFHKRKLVMAAPDYLPLRSDLGFKEGAREEVLETWERDLDDAQVNVRNNAEIVSITGERGAFELTLAGGDRVTAGSVVLAIGVQGNPRRLAIPGADLPFVHYQLDDPDEYRGEAIVVTGAGDAAIETALALAPGNRVTLVNRGRDYSRAKPANVARIRGAVASGQVQEIVNARPVRVGLGHIVLATGAGDIRIDCDRIIARIGTESRPDWLEPAGITFVGDQPDALPYLSETYETRVPGLYVIGALAGFPLIKHCLQQGYEVVEHILGNLVPPVDEPVLKAKLAAAGVPISVDELVAMVHRRMQLSAPVTQQQVRECLVHSEIRVVATGHAIFRHDDYASSLFWVFAGEVGLRDGNGRDIATLTSGQFFGAVGFISGRPRRASAIARSTTLLLEIGRAAMLRLMRSVPALKRTIDDVATILHITTNLASTLTEAELAAIAWKARIVAFARDDVLMSEGDECQGLYLIRKGAVTLSRQVDGRENIVDYLPAGNHVGADSILWQRPCSATATAASATEAIRIDADTMRAVLKAHPELQRDIEKHLSRRERELMWREPDARASSLVQFLIREGATEATSLLVIDTALCVHCDNCEKACEATHDGVSRLAREPGPTNDTVHLPVACRHCEHPACMEDCPADAIGRTDAGEIFISDACNGCGNCERNCPYGAIEMAAPRPVPTGSLLLRLLFGSGKPGRDAAPHAVKRAMKCDLCAGVEGGPACVRACPTGAAVRLRPEDMIAAALKGD